MRTRGQCEVTVNMNVTCAPCFRCLKLVLDTVYTRTHYKSHIWVNMFQCAANDKSSIFVYHWASSGVLTMSCFAWFQAKQPLFGHKSGRLHSQACRTPCWAQVCALQGVRQAWFPYRGSILEAWVSAGGWGRLLCSCRYFPLLHRRALTEIAEKWPSAHLRAQALSYAKTGASRQIENISSLELALSLGLSSNKLTAWALS